MTRPPSDAELAGLPAWLYPAGFWVAVVLILLITSQRLGRSGS